MPKEAKLCKDAGANVFVVGSYIYRHSEVEEKRKAISEIRKAFSI